MEILKYYYLTTVILATFFRSSKANSGGNGSGLQINIKIPGKLPDFNLSSLNISDLPALNLSGLPALNLSSLPKANINIALPNISTGGFNLKFSAGASPSSSGGGSPAAPTPPGSGAATPKVISLNIALPNVSLSDIATEEKIVELKAQQCKMLFADCWVSLKITKQHVEEDTRMNICVKTVQEFAMCKDMTEDQAKEAKDEIEEKLKAAWEEAEKIKNQVKSLFGFKESKKRKRNVKRKAA